MNACAKAVYKLGEGLMIAGFAVEGTIEEPHAWTLGRDLINALRMSPAPGATCCTYPVPGTGAGGVGFTLFQPLTDSFLAIDSWPEHKGAYVVVCSCIPFPKESAVKVLNAHSLTVLDSFVKSLVLVNEPSHT